jgi:peroxiredoxin
MNKLIDSIKAWTHQNGKSAVLQAILFIGVFWGIQKWQTRNLIPSNEVAPSFILSGIDGKSYDLSKFKGKPVVLYFFAPWCTVCKLSTGNVEDYYEGLGVGDAEVFAIALSYTNVNEIVAYQKQYGLTMPVLLGNEQVEMSYKVEGFPTFYFIDSVGKIKNHTIGFTSETGIALRGY